MATDIKPESDQQSMARLLSGIVNDAQELFKQQIALFRAEIREDFKRTRRASLTIGVGIGVGLLGVLLLSFMLVYLLKWLAPGLEMWGCYAIVGGLLLAAGGALCYAGTSEFNSFNPLPDQSLQALEENLRWQTTPK